MNKIIYADNAATTRVSDEVFEEMKPYFTENYGNPSAVYSIGRNAKKAVEVARVQVAKAINAKPVEIYFTSGGTEADNWAICSVAERMIKQGKNHIITSAFEHPAVLNTVKNLGKQGFDIVFLPVSEDGYVTAEQVKNEITEKTALVSIMYANNEIGTIQPVEEIGKVCRDAGVLFHTDAVQAVGNIDIDVNRQNIDMLSLSGHKFHAPKGTGALYIKQSVQITPFIHGGEQERNYRAGTENTASIVGMGKAIELCTEDIKIRNEKVLKLRDRLLNGIVERVPKCKVNGGIDNRLAGNLNISFEQIDGEAMLLWLDISGICVSSGSACSTGSKEPSHVLTALGLSKEEADSSVRITLNEENTEEEVDYIINKVEEIVLKLRNMKS